MSENPAPKVACPLRLAAAREPDGGPARRWPVPDTTCVAERCAWWLGDACAIKVIALNLGGEK